MKKILIIDDDPIHSNILVNYLKHQGYDVNTAKDGLQGVEVAKIFLPNLVIVDYIMPNLNGAESLKQIHKIPSLLNVPIILMSSFSHDLILEEIKDESTVSFLRIPYDITDLNKLIHNKIA